MTGDTRRLEIDRLRPRYRGFAGEYTTWFESGTPTAIIGPSGAGKSSLVNLIAGRVASQAGTRTLDGSPLETADVAWWSGELIEQSSDELDPVLVPSRSRGQFLILAEALGLASSVIAPWIANAAPGADLVLDLPRLSDERSIASLAAVLSTSAPVLLLDEPTMTVCAIERDRRLSTLLREMSERIIVICSHDAEWLRTTVSRVVMISAGQVVGDTEIGKVDFGAINAETVESMRERLYTD